MTGDATLEQRAKATACPGCKGPGEDAGITEGHHAGARHCGPCDVLFGWQAGPRPVAEFQTMAMEWDTGVGESPAAMRAALEEAFERGDRVVLHWFEPDRRGAFTAHTFLAMRRLPRLHWLTCFGYLTGWLQRWFANEEQDFEAR